MGNLHTVGHIFNICIRHCVLMKNVYIHTAGFAGCKRHFSDTPRGGRYILRQFKDCCTKISHAYIFGLLNCQQDTEHEPLLHVSAKFLSFTSFLPFQYPIVRTGGWYFRLGEGREAELKEIRGNLGAWIPIEVLKLEALRVLETIWSIPTTWSGFSV